MNRNASHPRNPGVIKASRSLAYGVGIGLALTGVGLIIVSEQPLMSVPLGVLLIALGYWLHIAIVATADYVKDYPDTDDSDAELIQIWMYQLWSRKVHCRFGKHMVIAETCTCFCCGKAFPEHLRTYAIELTDGSVVQVKAAMESIARDVLVYREGAVLSMEEEDEQQAFSAGGSNPPQAAVIVHPSKIVRIRAVDTVDRKALAA